VWYAAVNFALLPLRDDIGDGLFVTVIVRDDELQFDAHKRGSPGSSDECIARSSEDVSEVLVCYSLGVYETQSNLQATRVIA
jgi:hypothetical protein